MATNVPPKTDRRKQPPFVALCAARWHPGAAGSFHPGNHEHRSQQMTDTRTTAPTTPAQSAAPATAISPLVDKAKAFAKSRPFASAALVGVLGIALINTLRGKR
jgi:hypothetical protein